MGKRFNPKLAKIHHSYTVSEIGDLFGVHKNTVRQWIKEGLPTSDGRRPALILGRDLRSFLQAKKAKHKRKCKPYEFYCVRCRSPQRPIENMVDYEPLGSTKGRLIGLCPSCEGLINKFTSLADLPQLKRYLDMTITRA